MKTDSEILYNKIRGVIFGQAIGDALGLGTEFMTRKEVLRNYPTQLVSYSQIVRDAHRRRWKQGDWTDDTDMMLCIANAIIADEEIQLNTIAHNFKDWFNGSPMGVGRHTYNVLGFSDYTTNPMKAAEIIWKLSNENSAANGAVMRTSIVGLWKKQLSLHAENICKLTHADPRCIGSCVIISELISHLIWHSRELSFGEIVEIGRKYDDRIEPYLLLSKKENNIENLLLDDEKSMGYTLKTLSVAIWCLLHVDDFNDGLLAVVNAGGDADTNAAVACSILGAKYGFNNIPVYYVENLCNKSLLDRIVNLLFELLTRK